MSSLYLAYFVISADRYTDVYRTPGEVFRAPYDEQAEKLFDGNHQAAEIAQALPPTSEKLFTAQFLDKVRKPTGKLKELLTALDSTCNWKPDVPVRLHHAKGDTDVAYDNALYCQRQLRSHGATQTLTDAGSVDHNQTVRKALPLVVMRLHGEPGLIRPVSAMSSGTTPGINRGRYIRMTRNCTLK